mgnify:CR=1 FL=1
MESDVHEMPSIETLTNQMENLYEEFFSTDDYNETTEVLDKANRIITVILEGMKKDFYEGDEIKPILDLHRKIVLSDK